jgi:hypothetical protein
MNIVALYFPYEISLRAFISEEKLNIQPESGSLILRAALEERQVEKACSFYGAVPTEKQLI